ncbi:MAG: AAA family ATPase [Desulfovibrio sp.]|jgi:DNA repair protein RecN (Recombination protein N)|nr:AAA family ATPase [Desulfovibrio sp.]
MLEFLRIRNLALIEDLELEFAPGMNVLTGETGAGKSFILKALNFLTGERLGPDLVRAGRDKAAVEAVFDLDGEEHILRRELTAAGGRSRIFINDRLGTQESMRALRSRLILHSGQHGQQKLLQPSFQAALPDAFMRRPELTAEKDRLCAELARCAERLKALDETRATLEDKRELLEYQRREIEKVAPRPGEEEELEERRAAARRRDAVAENAGRALALLNGGEDRHGVLQGLADLERSLDALAADVPDCASLAEHAASARVALRDAEKVLRRAAHNARQEEDGEALEARLYALAQLKRKLRRPLDSILTLQREIADNLDFLDRCGLERKKLEAEEQERCAALSALLAELNPARREAAARLAVALEEELKGLGFSEHLRVSFEFSSRPLYGDRADLHEEIPRIFWQPNPGQLAQPLDRIASGGELSRFLLAVVSLMGKNTQERPTLIFDEIDAGVGGLTLNRVADGLEKLAAARQMLLITHWPQLAARAERHFIVSKEVRDGSTYTLCRSAAPEDIPAELARMAGEESAVVMDESLLPRLP